MTRPRVSLTRLLAFVAVLSLNCALLRGLVAADREYQAYLPLLVASSLAILEFLLCRGRLRRFYAGFAASGPAGVAVYPAAQSRFPGDDRAFTDGSFVPALDTVIGRLPDSLLTSMVPRSMADSRAVETTWYARSELGYYLFLTLTALVTSLPFLALALTAGLMALAVRGRPRSPLVSSPSPS